MLQFPEIVDFAFDLFQVFDSKRVDFATGHFPAINQGKQGTHLFKGKPQFTTALNKGETV